MLLYGLNTSLSGKLYEAVIPQGTNKYLAVTNIRQKGKGFTVEINCDYFQGWLAWTNLTYLLHFLVDPLTTYYFYRVD